MVSVCPGSQDSAPHLSPPLPSTIPAPRQQPADVSRQGTWLLAEIRKNAFFMLESHLAAREPLAGDPRIIQTGPDHLSEGTISMKP